MSEKIKRYPGTEIKQEDIKEGNVITTSYKLDLRYEWSLGIALGKFFNEIKRGKILGSKCNKCKRVLVPPRIYCEICFRNIDDWVYVKDEGKVLTFSICYVGTDARRLKEPQIPAVIELEGASEGIGILHVLGEVKPEDVRIGMRVKAVWKPEGERVGAITDIKYFRPL